MAQENCELCERDGAATPEIPAKFAICTSGVPLIYTCHEHLVQAKQVVTKRYGMKHDYHAILLTDDSEKAFQLARLRLPENEQQLASARIKLKEIVKSGSNMGVCGSCGERVKVAKREWDRAANPRCPACGAMLSREEQAMTPRELARHEQSLRRD